MVSIPKKISVLKTIRLRLTHVVNNTKQRNLFGILLYKKVKLEVNEGAHLILNQGRLEIGKHWTKRAVFPTLLYLAKNAKIIINGSFSVFDQSSLYVNEGATLEMGNGYMNSRCSISCFDRITIGNNVVISEGVTIRDSDNHEFSDSSTKTQKIEIQNNVWIGMNVTILKGVVIGQGSVIAAGAVVVDNVAPFTLVGGVPAKVLKNNINWIR